MTIDTDAATRISNELVRVLKILQALRQHAPKLHPGVEPASYPILFNLVDEPRRVSLLADCVHSDVSTVSRQVTLLASHGLLEKVSDPQDGRACMVSLSTEGKALVERLKANRGEWFRQMLHDWEPADAESFSNHLEHFADSVEASRDLLKSLALNPGVPLTDSATATIPTVTIPTATSPTATSPTASTPAPWTPVPPSGNTLPDTPDKEK